MVNWGFIFSFVLLYNYLYVLQDYPAEALKGSVALLRSKFGDSSTTDTSQIFGASPVARSKTFHSSNTRSPVHSKYNAATTQSPALLKSKDTTSNNFENSKANFANKLNKNNLQSSSGDHAKTASPLISKSTSNFCINNNNLPPKNSDNTPSAHSSISSLKSPKAETVSAGNSNQSIPEAKSNCRAELTIPLSSKQNQLNHSPVILVVTPDAAELASQSSVVESTEQLTENTQRKKTEATNESVSGVVQAEVSTPLVIKMADPVLVAKYNHITDIDELNSKVSVVHFL